MREVIDAALWEATHGGGVGLATAILAPLIIGDMRLAAATAIGGLLAFFGFVAAELRASRKR